MLSLFKNKNIYTVSDTDCDGVCSRVIGEYYIKPIAKNYLITNTVHRDMSEFNYEFSDVSDIIIFTDITPTVDLYKSLIENNKQVFIFDHHITAYHELKDIVKDNYYFDDDKCACKIFFENLTKNLRINRAVYQMVELCNCYDLYHTKSSLWNKAKSLHNIVYGYIDWRSKKDDTERNENFVRSMIYKFDNYKVFFFSDYEEILIQKAEAKERSNYLMAKKHMQIRKDNGGNSYIYTELNSKLSLIANKLLQEHGDNIQYIAIHPKYKDNESDDMKISLRSKGDFDVSNISLIYGGGGHKAAAGMSLPRVEYDKFKQGEIHLI